jgi:uncharacterized protein YbjQ (UPF0145 family)
MRIRATATVFLAMLLSAGPALGRSDLIELSVADAKGYPEAEALLDVPFYMAGQKHRAVAEVIGEYRTNRRTNAFNKTDEHACAIAFLSAIIQLQKRAVKVGGNAVVDIRSNTKDQKFESARAFRCAVGNVVSNVALIGRAVKLEK